MQREEKAIGDARASHRVRLGAMLAVACGMLLCWVLSNTRLTWIAPTARVYARRSGHFTVNVSGALSPLARMARYRLNGGEWSAVGQGAPRVQPPFFMIELDPARLRAGANRVSIETYAYGQWRPRAAEVNVNYDPSAVRLPVEIDWREGQLEIEEGCWEIADIAGERVARPKPGYEEYDRIAIIAGAFEGGRSIRAEMTFRGQICQRPFGFGVLSLWGGGRTIRASRFGEGGCTAWHGSTRLRTAWATSSRTSTAAARS